MSRDKNDNNKFRLYLLSVFITISFSALVWVKINFHLRPFSGRRFIVLRLISRGFVGIS